jgi:GDP-D-mannose dehydratase
VNYLDVSGIFAGNSILFNHDSERRGEAFETRTLSCTVMSPSTRRVIGRAKPLVYTTGSAPTRAC